MEVYHNSSQEVQSRMEETMTSQMYHEVLTRWNEQFMRRKIKARQFAAVVQALIDEYGPKCPQCPTISAANR